MHTLSWIAGAQVFLFAISAIVSVKNKSSTRSQKALQIFISFVFPIIGPLSLILVLRSLDSDEAPTDRYIGQDIDEMDPNVKTLASHSNS